MSDAVWITLREGRDVETHETEGQERPKQSSLDASRGPQDFSGPRLLLRVQAVELPDLLEAHQPAERIEVIELIDRSLRRSGIM